MFADAPVDDAQVQLQLRNLVVGCRRPRLSSGSHRSFQRLPGRLQGRNMAEFMSILLGTCFRDQELGTRLSALDMSAGSKWVEPVQREQEPTGRTARQHSALPTGGCL